MSDRFVHLHNHTEFSMLDGLGTVEEYVARAKELGQPALAITDHGVLCGLPQFYHACRKADIQPILGSEFYFVPDAAARPAKGEPLHERHHVVILARGYRGYQVLSELSTETHRNFHYKPLLDKGMVEALGDDAQHLVVLSGCAASIVSHAVRAKDKREASWWTTWWRDNFPHFYIELQNHETDFDLQLNTGLIRLARKHKLPWVITNDPHFVGPDDHEYHDRLLAVQTASNVDDPNRLRFDGSGYWLKSRAEMRQAFKSYGDEVWKPGAKATLEIAKLCAGHIPQWEKRHWHIPRFPGVDDSFRELKRLTHEGLRAHGWEQDKVYRARAALELKAFKQVGISDFLLITRESIQWAVEQGIPVGPGRGSVCGTLVGYLIGIHKIDPVRYNLMFERFLNPARPRMPDIDTDFGPLRRSELFDHVVELYGAENVVKVCTYGRMQVKAAFKSLAKSYGVSYLDANKLSKLLPDDPTEDGFEQEFAKEIVEKYPDFARVLVRLAGIKRSVGSHPAGVIIADPDDEIRKLVPELWLPSSKQMCGQYDLDAAEEMGLMKQDFLGLRNLETIAEAVRLIKETTGEELDPDSWVPDEEEGDDEVYAMLGRGETAGVFQMEGPTNQRGIKAVGCTCFEDIVSVTSLYRTGAISAGFPKMFIDNRKAGTIRYLDPKLEPILGNTWGVVIYQEQVMEMGASLAGFTMEQVDDIKEAIKHKKSTLMQSMKPLFVQGCMEHSDIKRPVAEKIWHMIEGYSGYGYNRSHAVAYTFVSYQTARLKTLWPAQFITALLRTVTDKGKRERYLAEAVRAGLQVLPPDVNVSEAHVTAEEGAVRFGLVDLAGIGDKAAQKLLAARPRKGFKTVDQVAVAVNNQGVMRILADAGALDCLGVEGNLLRMAELLGWRFHDPMENYREKWEPSLVKPEDSYDGNSCSLVGEIVMISNGTTKDKKPYATWHVRWDATNEWNVRLWSETRDTPRKLWDLREGSIVMVTGKWSKKWENVDVGNHKQVRVIKRVKAAN